MTKQPDIPPRVKWARLRFQIIGPLLASPPESGELGARLDELASKTYVHPITGGRVRFGRSTIERWLYAARNESKDPIRALERKVHARAGTHASIGAVLRAAIVEQHRAHPRWSYQLHRDNLVAWAKTQPEPGRAQARVGVERVLDEADEGIDEARSRREEDHAPGAAIEDAVDDVGVHAELRGDRPSLPLLHVVEAPDLVLFGDVDRHGPTPSRQSWRRSPKWPSPWIRRPRRRWARNATSTS
jgi:hypothetical protein